MQITISSQNYHLGNRQNDCSNREGQLRDGYLRGLSRRTQEHVVKLTNPYENYTSAVEFSPDGDAIAVGATDLLIRLLDAKTGGERAALRGHTWYPWQLAFAADGGIFTHSQHRPAAAEPEPY